MITTYKYLKNSNTGDIIMSQKFTETKFGFPTYYYRDGKQIDIVDLTGYVEISKKTKSMKDITKDKLLKLEFVENTDIGYNYYTYEINDDCLLISDACDENDGNFSVGFFDFDGIQITNYDDLNNLIDILKRNIIKK